MKIYLDACVIDWLLDNSRSSDFADLIRRGKLDAFVSAEVINEVMSTPFTKGDRRLRLLTIVFGGLIKFAPSSIPILGGRPRSPSGPIRRRSMIWTIPTPPRAAALIRALQAFGIKKLDAVHLVEADLANANAFVTNDKEDLSGKRARLRSLTKVEIVSPEEVLGRLWP